MTRTILAADVGGTHTRLALFEHRDDAMHCVRDACFASHELRDLVAAIDAFLGGASAASAIDEAAFGVPGPVVDGRVVAPNLPWIVDRAALVARLPGAVLRVVNDLEALSTGVLRLPAESRHVLQRGTRRAGDGNVAVIAAGTGLGESMLWWDGARHRAIASEGGHADFAPRGARQEAFARWLEGRFGHASVERALSGPGLVNVHAFLRETESIDEPAPVSSAIAHGDAAAQIAEAALAGASPRCVAALALFVDIYGQEAGNLATRTVATGGLFVGGGIAPKILPALVHDDRFLRALRAKGVFAPALAAIPVLLVTDPRAGLLGAAWSAVE